MFDNLGPSLYDFLKDNDYKPFALHEVRRLTAQLLTAVAFLHDVTVVHTDIKPENILLVSGECVDGNDKDYFRSDTTKVGVRKRPKSLSIRLIDFGSATFDHKYHTRIVSTRHYRAPEVLLEMAW